MTGGRRDARIRTPERFEGAKMYDPDAHARHAADLLTLPRSEVRPDVERDQIVAEATAHALTALALARAAEATS